MKHLKSALLADVLYEAGGVNGELITEESHERGISRKYRMGGDWHLPVERYRELTAHCEELGLIASAATSRLIGDFIEQAPRPILADWHGMQSDLHGRLRDELAARLLMFVEPDKSRFYTESSLLGPEVAERFPSAIDDIEEAGKCLAFGVGTACVFHLMRVMEVGLKHLAAKLGIPYAPSWESYLLQINARIQAKHRTKGIKWKRDEPIYRDLAGDLQTVKIAWRNPTMHIVRRYDPDQAQEVFTAVRQFMKDMASRLGTT